MQSRTMCNGIGSSRVGSIVKLQLAFVSLTLLAVSALPLWGQRARTEYALVLEDPPLAVQVQSRDDLAGVDAEAGRQKILEAQAAVRRDLESRGYQVSGAIQTLLNVVFVRASAQQVDELRRMPGVQRVASLPPSKLKLDKAAGLVNAPAAWSALGGTANAGAGSKIGIIDTGIDQTHPAFQDATLTPPAGFPKCAGTDCTYTNSKVIVARSYVSILAAGSDPTDPAPDSRPDDLSPRDRVGHGTANAMIAAGKANTSPEGITITGIAPKAFLGNYKIFGSPGINDFTFGSAILTALDDAFLDGMDIVSLSFGSAGLYGPLDKGALCGNSDPTFICDIRANAVQNAVSRGMVVVASAGNEADLGADPTKPMYNTISTPATAPAAISVGASTNSHVFFNSVRVPGSDAPQNLQRVDALLGDGPKPVGALTAPVRDVSTLGNDGLACTALGGGSLNGALALVQRGTCFFNQKVNNAAAAGAVGVIIYDNAVQPLGPPAGLTATSIPATMIENTSGLALKTFLATHPNHNGTIDPLLTATAATPDQLVFFSSRGPSIGEFGIKPELVAVGQDVFTATQKYDANSDMYDPSGYGAFSGTSFSAPMVAGAAALVHQNRTGATPADIKSALVDTASTNIQLAGGGTPDVLSMGAGKLDANAAISSTVSADPATVSFGNASTWPPTSRALKLKNIGSTQVTATLSASAPITLSQTSVPLAPGAAATEINVGVSGTAPAPGLYQGVITITGGAATLRVPYMYIRPDGVPFNMTALYGDGFVDTPGGDSNFPDQIAVKVVDRYGAPVSNLPVLFAPASGFGGTILSADARTDIYGIAAANVLPSATLGDQEFVASAGGMQVSFFGTNITPPAINTHGVVSAASGLEGSGQAPGSYVSFYGSGLSPSSQAFRTPYLPLSLAGVSVSFDAPPLSLPGRVHYVSPGQINVQVPWELAGLTSVQTKVSFDIFSTAVFNLTLNNYAPAIFQYPLASGFAAAVWNGTIVGTTNPVPRGQIVSLYVNGLGPVDSTIVTGDPTPLLPLVRTTTTPTVTIGGVPAQVNFSGLVPTIIGLYQVDVVVPAGAGTGSRPVVVSIGGVSSPTLNIPVS